MGWRDFVIGAVEKAHGKEGFLDTAIDAVTKPQKEVGEALHSVGRGVNAVSDKFGETGDWAQRTMDNAGLPKPVGSVANFFSGGGSQWVGRSFGDMAQSIGTIQQHEDDALKGVHHAAEFTAEHPREARLAVGAAGTWALNHKQDIAEFAGNAALESATDPASLALFAATGGGSSLLSLGEGAGTAAATAAAETAAESGALAATRAATSAAARQIATNVGERTATGLASAGIEGAEATAAQQAKAFAKQTLTHTYTGQNAPSNAFDRAATRLSRNPQGRIAQARRGAAESLANWGREGSLPRQIIAERAANAVQPGSTMPGWGGTAARDAWRVEKTLKNANRVANTSEVVGTGAEIATDPKGYAMSKLFGAGDTSSTGAVRSESSASSSITGDLVQPTSVSGASNYASGRGFKRPTAQTSRGATDLTSGESTAYEVKDPYAEGTAYGQAETSYQIKDPYQSLTQPKERPQGVLKPNKKAGVYT